MGVPTINADYANRWLVTDVKPVDLSSADATFDGSNWPLAFRVEGAGTLKITTWAGTDVTLTMVANDYLGFPVRKIWKTGTTATGIFAYYGQK